MLENLVYFIAGLAIGWSAAWFIVQRHLIGPLERHMDSVDPDRILRGPENARPH